MKCGRTSLYPVPVMQPDPLPEDFAHGDGGDAVGAQVIAGDAWDLLPELPKDSVDLVLTSPPYWGLRSYGHTHNENVLAAWTATGASPSASPGYEWYRQHGGVLGLEPYPSWYVDHLADVLDRCVPSLKPGGSMWLNLGDTYFGRWSSIREDGRQGLAGARRARRRTPSGGELHDKQLLLIPARAALALQGRGWILRNDVIWHKPNLPPRPETDRLRLSHEHLFHFVRRNPKGRPQYYYDLDGAEKGSLDVVTVPTDRGSGGHTASFPTALVAPRIASSCPPGGTVLDPFCGSGTTLAAALSVGRSAVGMELSPAYAAHATERLTQLSRPAGLEVEGKVG